MSEKYDFPELTWHNNKCLKKKRKLERNGHGAAKRKDQKQRCIIRPAQEPQMSFFRYRVVSSSNTTALHFRRWLIIIVSRCKNLLK